MASEAEHHNQVIKPSLNKLVVDDNFDFIKFLNDVRIRYDLSPTPLVEEDYNDNHNEGGIEHFTMMQDYTSRETESNVAMRPNLTFELQSKLS